MNELMIQSKRDKTLRALQQLELKCLLEIDRICRKNDIEYSLGGGSCLGQVRNGGIIPWDDDIDVDMTTDNFLKFKEACKIDLNTDEFYLRCHENDRKHIRSCMRLELKHTKISIPRWEKEGMTVGVFVDIFRLSYLPNNKFKRNFYAKLLFYDICTQNYKMFKSISPKINAYMKPIVLLIGKVIPSDSLMSFENRIVDACNKKTDWLYPNSIINGNHAALEAYGIDEYEDISFEGHCIRGKKCADSYLRTLYGNDYNKWLSPVNRISHHNWCKLNFGPYEQELDIPIDYESFLTTNYNIKKLETMKKESLKMLDFIDGLCAENNIGYWISGDDALIHELGLCELENLWFEPMHICMLYKDYIKFNEIFSRNCESGKYFCQNSKTDISYRFPATLVRLKHTKIHASEISEKIENKFNNGLYCVIVPIIKTSEDEKKSKRHCNDIKRHYKWLYSKAKYNGAESIYKYLRGKDRLITKITTIIKLLFPDSILRSLLAKDCSRYENENTSKYMFGGDIYSVGEYWDKCEMSDISKSTYCNYELNFVKRFCDSDFIKKEFGKNGKYEEIFELNEIKKTFPGYFHKALEQYINRLLIKIQKKYPKCYMTFYDDADNELSALRYDPECRKLLSNIEILGYD